MRPLVVEDSEVPLESLAPGLQDAGHVIDTASDGEHGLWLCRETTYDVVILDIQLPRMNGLDVLDTLRSDGDKVPVMMLTARNTVADRVRELRGGADDYLVKPFDFDELPARVEALRRRRRPRVAHAVGGAAHGEQRGEGARPSAPTTHPCPDVPTIGKESSTPERRRVAVRLSRGGGRD